MTLKKIVRLKFIFFLTLCQMISCAVSKEQFVNSISKSQKKYSAGLRRVNDRRSYDIPVISDLSNYLKVIKDSNNFSKSHLNDIDVNYAFGLFIINVNLKAALREKHEVPETALKDIEGMINDTTELLLFFFTMVRLDNDPIDLKYKHISLLISSPDDWVERLRPFSRSAKVDPKWRNHFTTWSKYKETLRTNPGAPGPTESDNCMSSMVANVVKWTSLHTSCTLHRNCYEILVKGGNLGYPFTHRLLLIISARLARGCDILSEEEDMELMLRICSNIYSEAEFIMNNNNNEFIDLLAEQIALCSLAGFSEFLHRSWLNHIIEHQKSEGCFGFESNEENEDFQQHKTGETKQWLIMKSVGHHSLLNGKCDGHLTAVAAGCIAAGVRLIMTLTDSTATNSTNV